MSHRPENLSEQTLRSAAVPSLEADPKQQQELRRSLMQEWRKRFDPSGAEEPAHRHYPIWLPRLGIAVGLAAMGLVIAVAYVNRSQDQKPTAYDQRLKATTAASNQGFTAAMGLARNDSPLSSDETSAVREAIARGYVEMDQ